jgi:uncharacterized protein
MTDITPIIPSYKKIITAYGKGGFKINEEKIDGNILLFPEEVISYELADIQSFKEKDFYHYENYFKNTEILLIGGGEKTSFFSNEIEKLFRAKNIIIDYMDTGAAARTYNVLLSEERKVAVVLIAV